MKLGESNQASYESFYILKSIKLETIKMYIESYLKTRFIRSFRSFVDTSIIFDKKLDNSLYLYVNY